MRSLQLVPEKPHVEDGAWKVLDVPEPIRFKKDVPKLCYNGSKRYKKTEWESPLQFFKELCLFMKYEKIYNRLRGTYNKVDAGIIMLLFANGIRPAEVPSYLLWDIKRLYHYTFFEGKGHKWSYKKGLLTPEEIAEHCPRLVDENNVDLVKTTDDPHWGSW
jgi:hypothetical protein